MTTNHANQYYAISIIDNGQKKYFGDTAGWVTNKNRAVWFYNYKDAMLAAFHEDLDKNEFTIITSK